MQVNFEDSEKTTIWIYLIFCVNLSFKFFCIKQVHLFKNISTFNLNSQRMHSLPIYWIICLSVPKPLMIECRFKHKFSILIEGKSIDVTKRTQFYRENIGFLCIKMCKPEIVMLIFICLFMINIVHYGCDNPLTWLWKSML